MNVSIKRGSATDHKIQTLVVFTDKQDSKKVSLPGFDKDISSLLKDTIQEKAFSGEKKEALFFRNAKVGGVKHLLVVGLGDKKSINNESARVAAAIAINHIKANKLTSSVAFDLESLFRLLKDSSAAVQAVTEGALLTDYDFDDYKNITEKDKKKDSLKGIILLFSGKSNLAALKKAAEAGSILADSTNFARWLGDHPGNLMPPRVLASETQKKAKGTGLKVTVWDKARIKKERMGGLYGVSLGSHEEPRFIIMEYKGAAASKKPVYLVGKGLTFDAGGVSIKPAAGMDEMKYDMCGGANVIGAMMAIARLKLKVNVVGLVPATENVLGPAANKPGDILTARNGKTIEVLNTDAEGRLILADALSYASEKKPTAIFDAATLTGAMVMALGNTHTGVFSRDEKLVDKVKNSADSTGELVWPMPLTDYHVEDMKGTFADLSNLSSFRGAGSSTAAAFLEQFVEPGIPWAHFDIAGTGWNVNNRLPYAPKKGASGVLVRTFVELVQNV